MWSRIYWVKTGRIELLFWKKDPAILVKTKSSIYSVDVPLLSVMQDLKSVCVGDIILMVFGIIWDAFSSSFVTRSVLSRNRIVAPLWYFSNSAPTRSLSRVMPILTVSVPIGQSSMSSVLLCPFAMNPISGTFPKYFLPPFLLSALLIYPGGPSKCGVSFVR